MKALIYQGIGEISYEERAEPNLENPTDVIVQNILTGVCGTDRNIYAGRFPAEPGVILGHEAVGIVHEVGSAVTDLAVGDRVIIDPTLHCGSCSYCREGRFNFCANKVGSEVGVDRDGSFTRYTRLPSKFLYQIPAEMSFERAVFVEPLACVLNNLDAANLQADDTVAVLGAGPIGMIVGMMAEKLALRVTVVERHPARVKWAQESFERVVDSAPENNTDWIQAVIRSNNNQKPRIVVDTTGVLIEESVDLVDRGGKIVLMGFNSSYSATIKPLYLTNNGISLIGAGDYNQNLPKAIHIAAGVELERLISHKFPLSEYETAFNLLNGSVQHSNEKGVMKVLFEIE